MNDEKYKKFLSGIEICNYILGALALGTALILTRVLSGFQNLFQNPALDTESGQGLEFVALYALIINIILGGLFLLNGFFVKKRKNKVFSYIIAGVQCLYFPIGTILGLFTMFVLIQKSTNELYGR